MMTFSRLKVLMRCEFRPALIGADTVQETIGYVDGIYLEFGADTRIEGISDPEKTKEIRRNAIKAGII